MFRLNLLCFCFLADTGFAQPHCALMSKDTTASVQAFLGHQLQSMKSLTRRFQFCPNLNDSDRSVPYRAALQMRQLPA